MSRIRSIAILSALLVGTGSALAQLVPWQPPDAVATAAAPATTQHPDAAQYAAWRAQIKKALYIPDPLPSPAAHSYGSFSPAPGVIAERVTYSSLYGMRVPAIVYRPEKMRAGRVPAIVVVNGHGGDKTSWYAYYTGILYARAGAIVVTYDPIGEDERNIDRKSASHAHDVFVPGAQLPERLGGTMIADIMQSVSYLLARPDVDPARVAVLGFSMGSFHSAIAGAIDPRIHALALSGGGNLGGDHSYWAVSPKVMCQSGPYKALSFLGDRAAVVYALNQQRGATLIMNGMVDPLIVAPNSFEPFFAELRDRTATLSGTRANLFETAWFANAGHRPNFITREGVLWLNQQLHLPNWTEASIKLMPEVKIADWFQRGEKGADTSSSPPGATISSPAGEGGLIAIDAQIPVLSREQLQAVPESEWTSHRSGFIYESFVTHIKNAAAMDSAR